MALVTIRVLEGADRGRVYDDLATPVSIGREDGNTIQLNDERISRFHLKIQEDDDNLVLTDLDSTNGTKVNGQTTQLHILRHGDLVSLGRSVLLFGSPEQIAKRLATLRQESGDRGSSATLEMEELIRSSDGDPVDFDLSWTSQADAQSSLQSLVAPTLPGEMRPGQAAQLAELLNYLHSRLGQIVSSASSESSGENVAIDFACWQGLLDLHARLARYIHQIGQPRE